MPTEILGHCPTQEEARRRLDEITNPKERLEEIELCLIVLVTQSYEGSEGTESQRRFARRLQLLYQVNNDLLSDNENLAIIKADIDYKKGDPV